MATTDTIVDAIVSIPTGAKLSRMYNGAYGCWGIVSHPGHKVSTKPGLCTDKAYLAYTGPTMNGILTLSQSKKRNGKSKLYQGKIQGNDDSGSRARHIHGRDHPIRHHQSPQNAPRLGDQDGDDHGFQLRSAKLAQRPQCFGEME